MFGPEGTGQYQGIQLLNGRDSSANVATGFIDFRNNLNIPDGHIFVDHQTDGGSTMILVLHAGARNSDRRVERLINSNGRIGINDPAPAAHLDCYFSQSYNDGGESVGIKCSIQRAHTLLDQMVTQQE